MSIEDDSGMAPVKPIPNQHQYVQAILLACAADEQNSTSIVLAGFRPCCGDARCSDTSSGADPHSFLGEVSSCTRHTD